LTPGTFRGKEAVGGFFGDWFRSFDTARFDITELRELTDGSILLVADQHARGRASGIELDSQVVWVYRLRDGKIVSVVGHETPEAAEQAAATAAES
jgi:ketosteroid isomerase-like protein